MAYNQDMVTVYTTLPSLEQAQTLSRYLVQEKLAACANIIPGVQSVYEWEGRLHEETEVAVLIKTTHSLIEAVFAAITAKHPYSVPALIAYKPVRTAEPYLNWLMSQTKAASVEL
jgi:periplasmic divalent cation tolerance protein